MHEPNPNRSHQRTSAESKAQPPAQSTLFATAKPAHCPSVCAEDKPQPPRMLLFWEEPPKPGISTHGKVLGFGLESPMAGRGHAGLSPLCSTARTLRGRKGKGGGCITELRPPTPSCPHRGSPHSTDAHGRTDGTSACSVPVDLDWGEGPEVGVAHVEQGAAGGRAPAEGGHVIPGGAADRHQPEGGHHGRGGDLQMGTQTRAAGQHSPGALLGVVPHRGAPAGQPGLHTFMSMPPWQRWRRAAKG